MAVNWTNEQENILAHDPETCARVLAGPGTGKSATMVEWIGRLLSDETAPKVRLLTFTRAATSELTKKVAEHQATTALLPSTVHSFAISVLLRNPGIGQFPEPLRIADDWEQSEIVNPTLARRIGVQPRRVDRLFKELAANWEALEEQQDEQVDPAERARFLASWQEHRKIYGYTLLSELPWALLNALEHHSDELEGIDYDLLVVDEYQDLNACDLAVLGRLHEHGCTIVAVGDDDQSIYSFRRAAPEGIRHFQNDYPGSGDYPLSITHRCGQVIMDWAANVIVRDTGRDPGKAVPSPSEGSPEGEVALLRFAGNAAEPNGIADIVENLMNEENVPASEILILLRGDHYGAFSRPIKEELSRRGIGYADPDEVKEQLSRFENRKLLAVCRLMANHTDSLAWATLLDLTAGVGGVFSDWIYELARIRNEQLGAVLLDESEGGFVDGPHSSTRARILVDAVIHWLDGHPVPSEIPEEGWGHWIVGLSDGNIMPVPTDEFAGILSGVDEYAQEQIDFSRYLSQISPIARDRSQAIGNQVRIMTMAASKGLTVEAAIVAATEEGIVPSGRPGANLNEECRLLYVAMTRAKRFLFCTWARRRTGPTARAGLGGVGGLRYPSSFFQGGPVQSQDGRAFINRRWPN